MEGICGVYMGNTVLTVFSLAGGKEIKIYIFFQSHYMPGQALSVPGC
jgi:hypothetical protein